jgi:hypothetical protein
MKDDYIGVVEPVEATAPRDHEAGRRITAERRRFLRQSKGLSIMAKTASPGVIDLISRKNPDLTKYIETIEASKIEAKKQKALPFKPFSNESESSKIEIQNQSETAIILVHEETGLTWWANGRPPETNSERYDGYCEMVKMGLDLTVNDWEWITRYERSDEWKQYYPSKNFISKTLQIKGVEDERKICDD